MGISYRYSLSRFFYTIKLLYIGVAKHARQQNVYRKTKYWMFYMCIKLQQLLSIRVHLHNI